VTDSTIGPIGALRLIARWRTLSLLVSVRRWCPQTGRAECRCALHPEKIDAHLGCLVPLAPFTNTSVSTRYIVIAESQIVVGRKSSSYQRSASTRERTPSCDVSVRAMPLPKFPDALSALRLFLAARCFRDLTKSSDRLRTTSCAIFTFQSPAINDSHRAIDDANH